MPTRTVVIIGGGIAGLATAVRLIQNGIRPIVLEKRPFLGGRAFSFIDKDSGEEIDNGQHVFVGACDQFQQYITDIGASNQIQLEERIGFPVLKNGKTSWLKARKLPGVLANLSALLGYKHVGLTGKLRILWGLLSIKLTRLNKNSAHDLLTFDDWLRDHAQSDETIRNFWNLIILPSLNDDITGVSAHTGIELFKVALLGAAQNPAMGIPLAGLSTLVGENAKNFIESNGGEIRTGIDVESLHIERGQITGVRTTGDELIEGEAVVSAVPAAAMNSLIPGGSDGQDDFFTPAESVRTAPIVAVHIWYDRPVLTEKFVATLDSLLQWVFNDTDLKSRNEAGQHVVISLSGAWEWQDRSKQELRDIFTLEMEKAFPAAGKAKITKFTIVKMLEATFRVEPGSQKRRLSQRTPLPGFYLAGDWTDTGWPSTMESAVRSGNLAAEYIVEDIRTGDQPTL
ncbi:hydroxysqualene dehydroxylase HpnE [Candidatus Lucifugimonas marina]|uniref:FAD-dependent oxidoreductase n=1 Tax=Candidatus Lucifugimonas marina TaxID=3038979 RepID=A0AAJ6CT62_9CHLR|nr:FAD-dependent oxidoreductase [SAR202 cluster bacterium JH639]WFG40013.1 FAD-dependent oxidoreductase [SAR202 cluster bacterium JH1073]